ncbi:hypothetical protein RHSIM_Rhsim11G0136300 [Rhododendron simsii]|uniref:Late embryogenesis abundant protein LEA-2 subgroup domain-containing protein n=1 Tax=Rhododendron simsii TaxID=118357 RepID=A0A834LBD4_RHOSS|nr:hypothetical protein RHSIM_Rhsim11G0136300 [Rhododendron simsii]
MEEIQPEHPKQHETNCDTQHSAYPPSTLPRENQDAMVKSLSQIEELDDSTIQRKDHEIQGDDTKQYSTNPPATLQQEMHIVQLPADQIYRTLPSRNSSSTTERITPTYFVCCETPVAYLCMWLFFILVIAAIFLIIIVTILYLALKPRSPKFYVENFTVGNPHSAHNQDSNLKYDVHMRSENPNSHVGFLYQKGGHAALFFKEKEIAAGEPPSFYHGKNHSVHFVVVLESPTEELPEGIPAVPLVLSMHVPVKLRLWLLKVWTIKMGITCNIRVGGLGGKGQVLSDGCHHKIHV